MSSLERMDREIEELVAQHRDRSPEDLVPDVEAIMDRYDVPVPSREGLIQWIDEALLTADQGEV